MAKGKSGRSSRQEGTRDALQSLTVRLRSHRPVGSLLREVDDLRTFDFEPGSRPARLFTGITAYVDAATPKRGTRPKGRVPYQIAFQAPNETLVCVRRQRRKEVLFAKKKTGKGGQRRARWSRWSNTKC